ncbi:MAG: hypothetical protein ACXVB9_05575 [Bdellovibrionota bacterium]
MALWLFVFALLAPVTFAKPKGKAPAPVKKAAPVGEWNPMAVTSKNSCRVKGKKKEFILITDFDNDGSLDIARLLENKKTHKVRLALWMNGAEEPKILFEDDAAPGTNYLMLALPGAREAMVAGKKTKYTIKFPSMAYGLCGGRELLYQWDEKQEKFSAITMAN